METERIPPTGDPRIDEIMDGLRQRKSPLYPQLAAVFRDLEFEDAPRDEDEGLAGVRNKK